MMPTKDNSSKILIRFSNTSDEARYVLKYHTPLEGLKSPFLAIKNNEGKEIKYNGYCFKRCPPTKKDFILFEGKEEKDCHINLTDAYAIPSDGECTIEYTKPLVCLTKEEMAESKITAIIGELTMPTSMPIKLQITGIIRKKKKDVPAGQGIRFHGQHNAQERNVTEALHHEVCRAYPLVIDAVDSNPAKYQLWFGHPNPDHKAKVKGVYEKCHTGLMHNTVTYHFRGPDCDDETYGYCQKEGEVFLCELYIEANEKSQVSGEDSKQQTLVHEWTHAYANTNSKFGDIYGAGSCIELAKNKPEKAIDNADNYGYFYCDIVENLPELNEYA